MVQESQQYEQKITQAVVAAEVQAEVATPAQVTFSSGVTLSTQTVSMMLIPKILARFPRPEVPELWDEQRGESIKNPNHPIYVEKVDQWEFERSEAMIDAILAFGTELINKPANVPDIEDVEWSEDLDFFGIPVPERGKGRYLQWCKYFALKTEADYKKLQTLTGAAVGTSEVGIAAQMEQSFPDNS